MENLKVVFLIISITLCSCKEKQKTKSTEKQKVTKHIYLYDTTQYIKHKSGFLVNKNGEVCQLNSVFSVDSVGNDAMLHFLDSSFGGNNKTIKEIIDLESFEEYPNSPFYEKDKNHIYFARHTSDEVKRWIIEEADLQSFKVLQYRWAKDKNYVYYSGLIVEKADAKTFQLTNERDSAMDKNNIYYDGEVVGKKKQY